METNKYEQLAEGLVSELLQAVNVMSVREDKVAKAIADKLAREHRTLQQGVVRVLAGVLVHYAGHSYDGRNEAAVRMCGLIHKALINEHFSSEGDTKVYLPTV
jgi:hypothetical protein